MTNIPDICKLPGYVFDKGVILGEVVLTGDSQNSKVYRVRLIHPDLEMEAIVRGKHLGSEAPLVRGTEIGKLVTINYDSNGLHVANKKYFKILREFFYTPDNRVRDRRFPHWEQDWHDVFSVHSHRQSEATLTAIGEASGKRWLEYSGRYCRVPVKEQDFISDMKGTYRFFPDSFYIPDRTIPRCLYKTEDDNLQAPGRYKGVTTLKKQGNRNIHIFIHGFPSPAKLHYCVAKHVLGVKPFGDKTQRQYWEYFEGKSVAKIQQMVFEKCVPNSQNTSCDEPACLKKMLFSDVHQNIAPYCKRYLIQSIHFFSVAETIKITVWKHQRYSTAPVQIKLECIRKFDSDNPFQVLIASDEVDRQECLILKGYAYDWHDVDEPTIHLFILTTYAGPIAPIKDRIDLQQGYIPCDSGTLSNIETIP